MRGRWRYYVCRGTGPTATRPRICWTKRSRMEDLDQRVWAAVTRAVLDPDFLYDRVLAQLTALPAPSDNNGHEVRVRIKALASEEKNLVAALRSAPSAAEGITAELERVASKRKTLERELDALQAPQMGSGRPGGQPRGHQGLLQGSCCPLENNGCE